MLPRSATTATRSVQRCRKTFDWEVELASLIAEPNLMVNSLRGSGGEGRPTSLGVMPPNPRNRESAVTCGRPMCLVLIVSSPSACTYRARRRIGKRLLLLCCFVRRVKPCGSGVAPLPEGEVTCPSCRHNYDPRKATFQRKVSSSVLADRKMTLSRAFVPCLRCSDCRFGPMPFRHICRLKQRS